MSGKRDFYEVLGCGRDATDKDLKKAYRKLARKYHPDSNPGSKTAEQKFKEINEAYDILSDPEKRKLYDQFGMAAFDENAGASGGGPSEQALTGIPSVRALTGTPSARHSPEADPEAGHGRMETGHTAHFISAAITRTCRISLRTCSEKMEFIFQGHRMAEDTLPVPEKASGVVRSFGQAATESPSGSISRRTCTFRLQQPYLAAKLRSQRRMAA